MTTIYFGKTTPLYNRMDSIFHTIDDCIEKMALFPALILIYSSIDFLGSLRAEDGRATGPDFRNWVNDYLLTSRPLPCNSNELWNARCGIVHTQKYSSDNRSVRKISYAIGFWDQDYKRKSNDSNYVCVRVDDLYGALKDGFNVFYNQVNSVSNPTIDQNLASLPDYIDLIPMNSIIKQDDDSSKIMEHSYRKGYQQGYGRAAQDIQIMFERTYTQQMILRALSEHLEGPLFSWRSSDDLSEDNRPPQAIKYLE